MPTPCPRAGRLSRPAHERRIRRPPSALEIGPGAPNAPPRKKEVIQTKLFVGNLSFETTSEKVRALFAPAGEIVNVFIPTDRDTGRPRGFAFVEFSTPEAAAAAIAKLDGHELDGRNLRVNEATERPARGPSLPRGGGGFNAYAPPPEFRARPKGSRRNLRARKRSL